MVGERGSDNVLPVTLHTVIPTASLGVIHPPPLSRPPLVPASLAPAPLTGVSQRVIPDGDIHGEIGEIYEERPSGLSRAMLRRQKG